MADFTHNGKDYTVDANVISHRDYKRMMSKDAEESEVELVLCRVLGVTLDELYELPESYLRSTISTISKRIHEAHPF